MKNEQRAPDLLTRIQKALAAEGIKADVRRAESPHEDARLNVEVGGKKAQFAAEVKPLFKGNEVAALQPYFATSRRKRVLIAPYVSEKAGQELRDRGILYVDAAGNAWLSDNGIHIFIAGRRRSTPQAQPRGDRAFRPAGLRLLFALLSVPDLINRSFREMAEASRVALGGIPLVLESLSASGFLSEVRGKRKIVNGEKLASEWAQAYLRVALAKNLLGRFSFTAPAPNWWRAPSTPLGENLWGGDVAAALLTKNLVPEQYSVYAERLPSSLLTSTRARKDDAGDLLVYRRFWHFVHPLQESRHVVPPLLIYAELLANGDARSEDAARSIYEEHVRPFIR